MLSDQHRPIVRADQTPPNDSHGEQTLQLERVSGKIALAVLAFVQAHTTFYGSELHNYVADRADVAPGSADRVLRALRREGRVNYRVVNRAKSLYEVVK